MLSFFSFKKRTLAIFIILLSNLIFGSSNIRIIKNTLSEINSKLDKISLKVIQIWGDEDEDNEELFFKSPIDIAVDNENHVYIIDSTRHVIKVFDSSRRFIRKIGNVGQGPGDIFIPLHLGIDNDNIIWVHDNGNRRIQVFLKKGRSISIFKNPIYNTSNLIFPDKNQIALYDYESALCGHGIIKVYNRSGILIQTIGLNIFPPRLDLTFLGGKYDSCEISFNNKNQQYCVAYKHSQQIQIFNKSGELTSCILYDTPVNAMKRTWNIKRKNFDILNKMKKYSECVDIDIDDSGRIFVVVTTRLKKRNELTSMLFVDGRIFYKPLSNNWPQKIDLYRLMVFGTDGKILATKQLSTFCSSIYIKKNKLYLIDSTFNKVIYEFDYKINDQK